MKTLINFFKSLWNLFLGTKAKSDYHPSAPKETIRLKHTPAMLFNKQQLKGKPFRNNGSTVRIGDKADFPGFNKLKYKVEKLI